MAKNKSFDMYCRFLSEQQKNFINQLGSLRKSFSISDDDIQNAVITLEKTAMLIISSIAVTDKPPWLSALHAELGLYLRSSANVDTKDRLMQSIIQHYKLVESHK